MSSRFLWGAATSSYQVEGGIENCDWAEAARRGKVPPAGLSVDHYQRYEADFSLARDLDHNAHRFSLEWARIEPTEGVFDSQAIEHYEKVLDALRARGLEPCVTLWHFTLPQWFTERGGFTQPDAANIFARYCEYVVSRLGDRAKFWMTINEPLVYASNGYRVGTWPPFQKNIWQFLRMTPLLAAAHRCAYEQMKAVKPNIQIGIANNNIHFTPRWYPISVLVRWLWNHRFLNAIKNHQDFIGLNYYFHHHFGSPEKLPKSDMGWDIYPQGLYHVLLELRRYGKPVYVTENGIADAADTRRAQFIRDHVAWMLKAKEDGVDVRGYFYWSLLDNYEWHHGFTPRFGLIAVNYDTLDRTIRPSARAYQHLIRSHR